MIKIINNQKTIKSFSLRLVDLNGSVVKTITETQYPVSTTIQIPFTEDDYNIMDNRLSVKLSVTYKDNKVKDGRTNKLMMKRLDILSGGDI